MNLSSATQTIVAAAVLATALTACNQSDSRNSPSPINATNSPSVSEELGVTVPSQDEADAAAAAEISAQNADAEFDALQKEVESGG